MNCSDFLGFEGFLNTWTVVIGFFSMFLLYYFRWWNLNIDVLFLKTDFPYVRKWSMVCFVGDFQCNMVPRCLNLNTIILKIGGSFNDQQYLVVVHLHIGFLGWTLNVHPLGIIVITFFPFCEVKNPSLYCNKFASGFMDDSGYDNQHDYIHVFLFSWYCFPCYLIARKYNITFQISCQNSFCYYGFISALYHLCEKKSLS
jgi:hypothetical protein